MSWQSHAACKGRSDLNFYPSVFYYGQKGPLQGQLTWTARLAVECCESCPVRLDCLDAALAEEGAGGREQRWGIRGGCTPEQRAELHKSLRLNAEVAS